MALPAKETLEEREAESGVDAAHNAESQAHQIRGHAIDKMTLCQAGKTPDDGVSGRVME